MKYFATALPGFGFALRREIDCSNHLRSTGLLHGDQRNDLVTYEGLRGERGLGLRTSEDVFVHLATHTRPHDAARVASSLLRPRSLESALSIWAEINHPLQGAMTYRVVARAQSERRFRRTELRDALAGAVGRQRPRWRVDDPASLEFWVIESRPDRFDLGLRLSSALMRQHGGRQVEIPGALRPTAAAAMLVAGELSAGQRVLDPACGSGTILNEAASIGLLPMGSDLNPDAVRVSRINCGPGIALNAADVRRLPLPDRCVDAVVSNLPFGHTHRLGSDPAAWFTTALREIERVVRPGGAVVILARDRPPLRRAIEQRRGLVCDLSRRVQLLGRSANLWRFTRRPGSGRESRSGSG